MKRARQPIPELGGVLPLRRSASADASRRLQIEEELAMSPRERVLLALQLGERMRLIEKAARESSRDRDAP